MLASMEFSCWGLLRLASAVGVWTWVLLFASLASLQSGLISATSSVAGQLYKTLIEADAAGWLQLMLRGAILYAGAAAATATGTFLSELAALRWRLALAGPAQEAYCRCVRLHAHPRPRPARPCCPMPLLHSTLLPETCPACMHQL